MGGGSSRVGRKQTVGLGGALHLGGGSIGVGMKEAFGLRGALEFGEALGFEGGNSGVERRKYRD